MERAICIGEGEQKMSVPRQTELGLYKTEKQREKVRAGPGLRECEAGYETKNCGELCVSRRVPQTKPGRYKTEREMGSPRLREFKNE